MKPNLKQITLGAGLLLALTSVADENVDPVAHVQVSTVRMEKTSQQIIAYGRIVPAADGSVKMTAPFGCRIVKVLAANDQRVKKGDVLIEVAPDPDSQLMLATARQAFAAAKLDLSETKARFDLKLADRQEVMHAQQALADAQMQLDTLTAQGLGGDGQLKAPCDGVVGQLNENPGDLLTMGASLARIDRPDHRELLVGIEPEKASQLKTGQDLTARAALRNTEKIFTGHILRIGRTVDPASGLVRVAAALDGAEVLATQEYIEAIFEVNSRDALTLPASSVLPDGNAQMAFTVVDGHAVRHSVKTEMLANGWVRLLAGDLKAGDLVVHQGNYELEDGMPVTVEDSP